MNIGLDNICLISVLLMLRFGCKINTANRTKPCGWVRKQSEYIWTKCGSGLDWFGLRFLFYQPNQTKSNRNIRKTLIKHMLSRPIFIETKLNKNFIKWHSFSLVNFLLYFLHMFLIWFMLLKIWLDENKILMFDEI